MALDPQQPNKCKHCGADTIESDECHKCVDNPERQDFFKAVREAAELPPTKTYPSYAQFCDDPEEKKGFKSARIAKWLAENEHFKTDRSNGILYYGDTTTGIWDKDGETRLHEIVTVILGDEYKEHHFKNILSALKGLTYTEIKFSKKISVENGLLDLETLELTAHNLDEMAFYSLPVPYNPEAKSEHFLEFLKQVLPKEDDRQLIQEWSGYLLLPDYRFHKLMWLHGEGRNGKGVWQRTMEDILGENNVSSLGLEEFDGNHRFALERLYGKLFNPCSEPTTNRVLQTALLKKATGQDTIEAEVKLKQKRNKFRNTAKITVIANRFPKVRDSSLAFKDRRLFVTFPNQFVGPDQIPNLEQVWLTDPIERMGILNWQLDGLQRLLINNGFTESQSQQETEIQFERASDTVAAFLTEQAIFDKNLVTTRADAYERYKEYCDLYGLDLESDKKFTQRLKETLRIKATRTTGTGRPRVWQGIAFKTPEDVPLSMENVPHVPDLGHYSLDKNEVENIESNKTSKCGTNGTSGTRLCKDHCCNWGTPLCPVHSPTSRPEDAVIPLKCGGYRPKQ